MEGSLRKECTVAHYGLLSLEANTVYQFGGYPFCCSRTDLWLDVPSGTPGESPPFRKLHQNVHIASSRGCDSDATRVV
jgi:hypothetical protein